MFTPNHKPFMNHVIDEEVENFTKNIDPSKLVENGKENFYRGNVLFKTLPLRTSLQRLLKRSRVITKRDSLLDKQYPKSQHYDKLFRDVTHKIITIGTEMELNEAINAIYKVKLALGNRFYGAALISKDKMIINPLHPTVATSILSNPEVIGSKKLRVVVFCYSDREAMDAYYNTANADHNIIEENIKDLINSQVNAVPSEIKIESYNNNGNSLSLNYRMRKFNDEVAGEEYYIVIHQILTSGTFCPYYGASIVKLSERGTSGVNVSPMISCNISNDRFYSNGRSFDSGVVEEKNINVQFTSVCTGSLSNRTLTGLRSLTHSNASSPYNTEIITDGSLAYADACVEKSFAIYKLVGIIPPEEIKEDTEDITNDEVAKEPEVFIEEPKAKRKYTRRVLKRK